MFRTFLTVAGLIGVALAVAGSAPGRGAAYNPSASLLIFHYNATPGQVSETVVHIVLRDPYTAPLASVSVYVPQGYGMTLNQAPGTKLGDAFIGAIVRAVSPAGVGAGGTIAADDPAKYATDPQAQACAPGTHAAVWVVSVTISGQALTIPIFVDPTGDTESQRGAFRLLACFASPDAAVDQGGSRAGITLRRLDLDLTAVFTNPAAPGTYLWRGFYTGYTAGTATADANSTVEVRADVPLPQVLTAKAAYLPKTMKLVVSGRLLAVGKPRDGIQIELLSGPKRDVNVMKRIGEPTTGLDGSYTLRKRMRQKTVPQRLYILAKVEYYARTCEQPPTVPAGCTDESISPPLGKLFAAVIPNRAPKK